VKDEDKTKEQLIKELWELRHRIAELETSEKDCKRAKEEIRRLSSAVAQSIDGIAIGTIEPELNYVNDAFARMHGYSPQEMVGLKVRHLHNVEQIEAFKKRIHQIITEGSWMGEIDHIKKDGTPFPTYMSVTLLKDEKGKPTGILAVCRDITEHRRAEEEMEIKEIAIASSINAIAIADLEGNLTYVNNSLLKMWGYNDEKEVLGKNAATFWQVEEEISEVIETLHEKGGWMGELVAMKKDGSLFDVQLSATMVKNGAGKPICMMGSFVDITERKRTCKKLHESEEKYRNLFENANDAILIADTKTGIILDANKQAEQLIGRPRQEIIGMHQSGIHPEQCVEYYKEKFHEHVQKGQVFDLEAEIVKKDGSIVPVFISASVVRLDGKEVIQGLFRDITEEKRILELKEEIAARKMIDKAKGIMMNRYKIIEKEAMRRLQKESRRQRKKIKEIAQAVISSEIILD
jgi:PAS domain S-box-containing protein